jgi:hypothetical protein
LQNWREEWILVWRVISANKRVEALSLGQEIVAERNVRRQRKVACRYGKGVGIVDGRVEGKLNPLNKMKSDGVFETTGLESVAVFDQALVRLT